MLRKLKLTNYRGFENSILDLKPVTIMVGRNNAGKSTLVEALRLVSIVTSRYRNLTYHPPEDWLEIPHRDYGVSPSLRDLEMNLDSLFYRYGEPPAIIQASFSNRRSVTIYLGEEGRIHAIVRDGRGDVIRSKAHAHKARLPKVSIMPQVAPVARNEVLLSPDYVESAMSSPLAPLHFRNQLWLFRHLFPEFRKLAEETWPGIQVRELVGDFRRHPLFLHVRNEEFVGEIVTMGHGVQMWLQTIWFLTHAGDSKTVILDEPDVYMHPDLQRKLIRFLRGRFSQIIVTTHSTEIMSEVEPDDILIVERRSPRSHFAGSLPAVQRILARIIHEA